MANWLDKALGRQGEEPDPEPVPFELTCDCGLVLQGVRAERSRRVICTQCGRAQFVLPMNQFPVCERRLFANLNDPDRASGSDGLRMIAEDDEVASEDSPEDVDIDAAMGISKKPSARRQKAEQPSSRVGTSRREPQRLSGIPLTTKDRGKGKQQVLIVIGVFMVLAIGMLIWAIISHRHERSERTFKESGDAGLAAFESGDFTKAESLLAEAVVAADSLKLSETQSATVRSRSRHAESIVRLSDIDLFELVTAADKQSFEQWAQTFSNQHQGKWVILSTQAKLQTTKTEKGEERFHIDLLGFQPPVRLVGLEQLAGSLRGPLADTEVLLAGRLQDCRKQEDVWQITFSPGSAFLWQDLKSLQRMGLFAESDEAAQMQYRAIVERQSHVVQTELKSLSEKGKGRDSAKN